MKKIFEKAKTLLKPRVMSSTYDGDIEITQEIIDSFNFEDVLCLIFDREALYKESIVVYRMNIIKNKDFGFMHDVFCHKSRLVTSKSFEDLDHQWCIAKVVESEKGLKAVWFLAIEDINERTRNWLASLALEWLYEELKYKVITIKRHQESLKRQAELFCKLRERFGQDFKYSLSENKRSGYYGKYIHDYIFSIPLTLEDFKEFILIVNGPNALDINPDTPPYHTPESHDFRQTSKGWTWVHQTNYCD
jgi:hypothetical protein